VYTTLNAAGTVPTSTDTIAAERAGSSDYLVYDDFVIASGATIRTISWQGSRVTTEALQRFYVAIMADSGAEGRDRYPIRQYANQRPVALWSATYPASQVNERLEMTITCGYPANPLQCGYYDYSVGLTMPFVASPGTRYWVMIQSEFDATRPLVFFWRKGTRDNGFSTSGTYASTTFPWDMAFALRP
jgi:hypothetical protein